MGSVRRISSDDYYCRFLARKSECHMNTQMSILVIVGLVSHAYCQMVWRQMPDQSRYVWGVMSEDGVWVAEDCGTICHTPSKNKCIYNAYALQTNAAPVFQCLGFTDNDALVYFDPFAPGPSVKVGLPSFVTNTVTIAQTQAIFTQYSVWDSTHNKYINSDIETARLSWNGKWLIYWSVSNTKEVRDYVNHLVRMKLNDDGRTYSSAGEVWAGSVSPSSFFISDDGNTVVRYDTELSFVLIHDSIQTTVTYQGGDYSSISLVDMSPDGKYVYGNLSKTGDNCSFVWSAADGFRLIDKFVTYRVIHSVQDNSFGCIKIDTTYTSDPWMYWSQASETSISFYQYLHQLDQAFSFSSIVTAKIVAYARNGRAFWFATGKGANFGSTTLDTTAVVILSGPDERKPKIQGFVSDTAGVHISFGAPTCWTNATMPTTTLERRESLSVGQWLPIAIISGANSLSDYLDAEISQRPQAFYRVTTR